MIAPELRPALYGLRPTPITVGFDNIALSQRARQSTAHTLTNREGTGNVANGLVGLVKTCGPWCSRSTFRSSRFRSIQADAPTCGVEHGARRDFYG
jgi:hypothetical protein